MSKPTNTQDVFALISVASEIFEQHKDEGEDRFPIIYLDHYGDFAVEIRRTTPEEKACASGDPSEHFEDMPEEIKAEVRRQMRGYFGL